MCVYLYPLFAALGQQRADCMCKSVSPSELSAYSTFPICFIPQKSASICLSRRLCERELQHPVIITQLIASPALMGRL